jgi:hypothetical protein
VEKSSAIIVAGSPTVNWAEQPLLLIRKTILSFLQGLFELSDSGHFKWHEDQEATEIFITDESPMKMEVIGKRPAICTVRGTVAFGKTSLDEMQARDFATGFRKHTDLVSGTMTVNCCSRAALESEYIAWIVANHCWLLRRLVMRHTPVHEFGRGATIGAPSPAGAIVSGDTEGEWICTPVSLPFFLQVSGRVTPLNLTLLKEIEAKLSVRGGAQIGPTGVRGQARAGDAPADTRAVNRVNVRPPTIRGRPIRQVAFEQSLTVKKES